MYRAATLPPGLCCGFADSCTDGVEILFKLCNLVDWVLNDVSSSASTEARRFRIGSVQSGG